MNLQETMTLTALAAILSLSTGALAESPTSTSSKKVASEGLAAKELALPNDAAQGDGASLNRGFGSDCYMEVSCNSGRLIWCRNSNVSNNYFSVCIKTTGSTGLVVCTIDNANGTITDFTSDSCP